MIIVIGTKEPLEIYDTLKSTLAKYLGCDGSSHFVSIGKPREEPRMLFEDYLKFDSVRSIAFYSSVNDMSPETLTSYERALGMPWLSAARGSDHAVAMCICREGSYYWSRPEKQMYFGSNSNGLMKINVTTQVPRTGWIPLEGGTISQFQLFSKRPKY